MKPASKPLSPNSGAESSSRSDELKNRRKRSKKRSVVGDGEKASAAVDKIKISGDGAAAVAAAVESSSAKKKKKEKREQNAVKFLNVDGQESRFGSFLRIASDQFVVHLQQLNERILKK
uniref:Uncharacterized protein n=1 Tax=Romanomermis culicivorax TaxID=13658 RepID=A0A915JIX1_ROMCU